MANKLKLLRLLFIATLTLAQISVSQAADDAMDITLDVGGEKMGYLVSPGQYLSVLRKELIESEIMQDADTFQVGGRGIIKGQEGKYRIEALLKEGSTLTVSRKKTVKDDTPHKAVNASTHYEKIEKTSGYTLKSEVDKKDKNAFPSQESVFKDPVVANNPQLADHYSELSKDDLEKLFERLRLRGAIITVDANDGIKLSGPSVTWEGSPAFEYEHRMEIKKEFSSSQEEQQIKKLGIANAAANLNLFGFVEAESNFGYKNERLKRDEGARVYVIVKHHVPKIVVTIGQSSIKAPSRFEEGIRRLGDNDSRRSYKKLIDLFDEYGFYVPTRFVIGGQMIFEDTSIYQSKEAAEKSALTLASEIQAGYGGVSGGIGFGAQRGREENSVQAGTTRSVTNTVRGGNPITFSDPAKWLESLAISSQYWVVIERDGLIPITKLLSDNATEVVKRLNKKHYAHSGRPKTLWGMKESLRKTPQRAKPVEMRLTIPPVAQGHEAIYQRFLNGVLIYRPNGDGNDAGRINLPIRDLGNPLEGTFDLSRCGDTGKYLSISTGYRKGKKAENASKVEIWFAPRFLIEKELNTTAAHFKPIMGNWKQDAPVGIFWTWWDDDLKYYDYLTTKSMEDVSKNDLYENWRSTCGGRACAAGTDQTTVLSRCVLSLK